MVRCGEAKAPIRRATAREAVLAWIARNNGKGEPVVVTTKRIAEELGYCEKHIKRTIHELRKAGKLESGPTWTACGGSGPNWYKIT